MNLTGHDLVLGGPNGIVIPAELRRARVQASYRAIDMLDVEGTKIPIIVPYDREVINLPEPQNNVLYVVSNLLAERFRRQDLLAPARVSRDRNGKVIFARALMRYE